MSPDLLCSLDSPRGHGFVMRGWDFTSEDVLEALRNDRMLNPAFELGTNACPWNCSFCFTEDPQNPHGAKRRLRDEMGLERRLRLLDEAAELGARSINFVGAGEPTIDPDFWEIVEHIARRGMVPIIYTEGALRLRDLSFVRRLFELGATIVLKMNSMRDAAYQDRIVRGGATKKSLPAGSYSVARDEALRMLLAAGFADAVPTRLAFDTIVCRSNLGEIADLHRFARRNNIFVLFVNYLPSGRSQAAPDDALSQEEQRRVFSELASIDRLEHGIERPALFPYGGGVACTIRGLGLYVKIGGAIYDCPGEAVALGHLNRGTLRDAWERAAPIRRGFDGGCLPRAQHFSAREAGRLALPVLPR